MSIGGNFVPQIDIWNDCETVLEKLLEQQVQVQTLADQFLVKLSETLKKHKKNQLKFSNLQYKELKEMIKQEQKDRVRSKEIKEMQQKQEHQFNMLGLDIQQIKQRLGQTEAKQEHQFNMLGLDIKQIKQRLDQTESSNQESFKSLKKEIANIKPQTINNQPQAAVQKTTKIKDLQTICDRNTLKVDHLQNHHKKKNHFFAGNFIVHIKKLFGCSQTTSESQEVQQERIHKQSSTQPKLAQYATSPKFHGASQSTAQQESNGSNAQQKCGNPSQALLDPSCAADTNSATTGNGSAALEEYVAHLAKTAKSCQGSNKDNNLHVAQTVKPPASKWANAHAHQTYYYNGGKIENKQIWQTMSASNKRLKGKKWKKNCELQEEMQLLYQNQESQIINNKIQLSIQPAKY